MSPNHSSSLLSTHVNGSEKKQKHTAGATKTTKYERNKDRLVVLNLMRSEHAVVCYTWLSQHCIFNRFCELE
jgi:hypothetical protein